MFVVFLPRLVNKDYLYELTDSSGHICRITAVHRYTLQSKTMKRWQRKTANPLVGVHISYLLSLFYYIDLS